MQRGKLINFRLPFAIALSFACGTGFAFALAYYNIEYFYVIAAVPFSAVIFILFALFARRTRTVVNCALVLAVFAFGAVYTAVNLSDYQNSPQVTSGVTRVTGRVEGVQKTESGTVRLILSDVTADGARLKGRTIAYLDEDGGGYAEVGYTVSALCSIEKCDLFTYGKLNYGAIDGIRYKCIMYGTLKSEYGFSLFGSLNTAVCDVLNKNLSYETAAVVRAMLTGDTSAMDSDTLSGFRYGGVAHIFAVSGLHIGIIFSALSLLFKKLKFNKYLSAVLKIGIIFFYAGACGFTPSSVRAAVMCTVLALSKLGHRKYDLLNSLSVAAVILLAVNPLNLFDIGFVLSVSAMLGIIFLSPVLRRVLPLPKSLKSGVSVSISAQAATFPGQMLAFGYVSAVGLLLNVFILPVLSILYAFAFFATLVCLIVPPAAAVLPYVCLPLEGFINLFVSAGFENAIVSGISGWWAAVLPAIFLAALSDKFNLKLLIRAAICAVCAVSFALATVFDGAVYGDGALIITDAYYGGSYTLIRTSSGGVLVVTQETDAGRINTFVNRYAADKVKDIVVLGDDGATAYYIQEQLGFENVYIYPGSIDASGGVNAYYVSEFSLFGAEYRFLSGDSLAVSVSGVNCTICVEPQGEVTADLLISLNSAENFNGVTACYGVSGGDYNVYSQGCLQFGADNGRISVKGLLPLRGNAG